MGVVARDTAEEDAGDVPFDVEDETVRLLFVAALRPVGASGLATPDPSSSTSPNLVLPPDVCLGTGYNDDCLAGGTIWVDLSDAVDALFGPTPKNPNEHDQVGSGAS